MLQARANPPRAFLRKAILLKLQTAPGILSYTGKVGAKRDFKSANETWGYKNITSFKNTIAESFRVSLLSTADKQSEQFGNEDTRQGSGIRNHNSNQWEKTKTQTDKKQTGAQKNYLQQRLIFFCRSMSPTPLHTSKRKLWQQETNCYLLLLS